MAPQSIFPNIPARLRFFYHHILCCATKLTLIQAIKDGSFKTWSGLTERLISKYLPESYITAKGNLDQQKQQLFSSAATNVTPLATNEVENTSEVLLQIFDPTEKLYSDLTVKFPVQLDIGNNYILVAYHYDANNILTTPLKKIKGLCILNGITKIRDKLRTQGLTPKLHIV